jgi:hypothetical protein
VDLGTAAGKKTVRTAAHKELKGHDDKARIDEMTAHYEDARRKHDSAMKHVQDTQVELDRYGKQLEQIKSAHVHSVRTENERKEAEAVTRQKAQDADDAYKNMKEQMADLHKTGVGLKG